jgi:hypothetical protein
MEQSVDVGGELQQLDQTSTFRDGSCASAVRNAGAFSPLARVATMWKAGVSKGASASALRQRRQGCLAGQGERFETALGGWVG